MASVTRRSWLTMLAVALGLCVLLLTATAAPAKYAVTKCGRAAYNGEKVPVYSHKLSCKRAKKIARYFLRTDKAPSTWKVSNLAGCEWTFARKGTSKFRWRVLLVRLNGCED